MTFWKKLIAVVALSAMLVMSYEGFVIGAVSPEEAKNLGTTLTLIGAERAGNSDGTIPEYTGGLTKPPADYKSGSGIRPDPFVAEKPLFSINSQNMGQYVDKLTAGAIALIKKYPEYRMDIYKSHRTVAYPEYVLENTVKNAVRASTYNDGLSIRGARAGIPFPIPKNGYETMWNHLLRYNGRAYEYKMQGWLVDSNGKPTLAVEGHMWHELPYYDNDTKRYDADLYWKFRWLYTGPPRSAGEDLFVFDPINIGEKGRICWQYLPGQRRVKLAPEIAFDTPNAGTAGANTYDDYYLFNGSMERYNFKLIGKKEIYVPYNAYRAVYMTKSEKELLGPKFVNPDVVRWELHRVWVVEATLKPGKRHIYKKRVFYLDEDAWSALASESYDAHGNLYRIGFAFEAPSYDMPAPSAEMNMFYDLIAGSYNINVWFGKGYNRTMKVLPARAWTPEALAAKGR